METLEGYLDALASESPAPGGGSASAVVGATAAALLSMVARICARNPRYAQWDEAAHEIIRQADHFREELLANRQRDEAAFSAVVAAQALPAKDDAEKQMRRDALEAALKHAANEPLHAAHLAFNVMMLALRTLEIPNRNLASDVGCAAEFAYAALLGCAYNVRINHRFMHDTETIASQEHRLKGHETEAAAMLDTIRSVIAKRLTPSSS